MVQSDALRNPERFGLCAYWRSLLDLQTSLVNESRLGSSESVDLELEELNEAFQKTYGWTESSAGTLQTTNTEVQNAVVMDESRKGAVSGERQLPILG